MNIEQSPRKFQTGDTVLIRTGLYAGITTKVTGCYVDELHGGIPYVTVDLCQVPFYEDALMAVEEKKPAPSDEPQRCEVCQKPNGPFIRVEVSEDEGGPQWFNVCSDECLQQIILRWKQIGEIIRPGK